MSQVGPSVCSLCPSQNSSSHRDGGPAGYQALRQGYARVAPVSPHGGPRPTCPFYRREYTGPRLRIREAELGLGSSSLAFPGDSLSPAVATQSVGSGQAGPREKALSWALGHPMGPLDDDRADEMQESVPGPGSGWPWLPRKKARFTLTRTESNRGFYKTKPKR